MDIPRPELARRKRRRRILYSLASLLVLVVVTVGLAQLEPASPPVDKATIWTGTVERGEMLRQVRGNGTLVPEQIRWIAAGSPGRIEKIEVLPGAAVTADTVLLELSNPELEQAALEAEWQLKASEAEFDNLKVQLESQRLAQEAATATLESELNLAELDATADSKLAADGLVAELAAKRSEARASELKKRLAIERERLNILAQSAEAQLAVQKAKLEQLRALVALKRRQVEGLQVRAGMGGVVQKLGDTTPLQIGQQVSAGASLALVADPTRLKAEIRVPEILAKDLLLGQSATVDTRNGVIAGRVVRIDPAVQEGTVTIDVALEGPLPKGARPDLTVDGTIEIERLEDVLYVGRPIHGQSESSLGLFRVAGDGKSATRTSVRFGRSSVSTIEVLEGLNEGDRVILSDMSEWDSFDRVRLN